MFWIIYLNKTDGKTSVYPCNSKDAVKKHAHIMNLHDTEYAVIKGECYKNIGQDVWNS